MPHLTALAMQLRSKLLRSLWRTRTRQRYLRADRTCAPYSLISAEPPIFYVKHWMDEQLRLQSCLDPLFHALHRREAWFLYSWRWWIETPERIAHVRRLEGKHRGRYPQHHFIHLCNTARQWEEFRNAGLDAVFCNQNCFVDERIYQPLPKVPRTFDAVYDARLKRYKRHGLARDVPKLAILYIFEPDIDDAGDVARIRRELEHAHVFNHPDAGDYHELDREEINRCLNACRVGLCLSQREGAMYASMQYLLAGLPVVSTASEGGRDVFFDDAVARIVPDDPDAVREAVADWVTRDVPPEQIRRVTLEKVELHRRRFVELVQSIYDRAGAERRFASEWRDIYFDKLFHERQQHTQILRRLG